MRIQGSLRWLFRPDGGSAPPATILIRLAVGGVFFASGLIKFLYANQGAGRFAKLGIPAPPLTASFVGVVEIAAGILLAVGLATRLAAIPLIIDMLVAIGTSKLPMLWGAGPEPVAAAPKVGLWAFVYQARLDSIMLLGCLFLLAVGAGAWSLDAWCAARARNSSRRDDDCADGELFEAVTAAPNGRARSTRGRAQDQSMTSETATDVKGASYVLATLVERTDPGTSSSSRTTTPKFGPPAGNGLAR